MGSGPYKLAFIESIIFLFWLFILPIGLHMALHSWGMFSKKHGMAWTIAIAVLGTLSGLYLIITKGFF